MPLKLFIVGLPGSGKSAIARYIAKHIVCKSWLDTEKRWFATRFNDYPILHTMFRDDNEGKRFEPAQPGGFNVLDFGAFDDALKLLGNWITWHITSEHAQPQEILLIEFARNDYRIAFQQFKRELLQDAYFIYLGSEVKVCQQRIRERVAHPENEKDDYPISDYIFEKYYHSDDGQLLTYFLNKDFKIDRRQVLAINNNCSLKLATEIVTPFIDLIVDSVCSPPLESTSTDTSDVFVPGRKSKIGIEQPGYCFNS